MVLKIGDSGVKKKIELRGKPYEDAPAEIEGAEFLRSLCPDSSGIILDKMVKAVNNYAFGEIERKYNEYHLFRAQYEQIAQVAYRESGLNVFNLYQKYLPVVEAAVLELLTEKKTEEPFFGGRTYERSDQFMIRQICTDTFNIAASDRTFSITDTSATAGLPFLVVPRSDVGVIPPVLTYLLPPNDQMILIFYYQSDLGPRVLESVEEAISDELKFRVPFDIYSQLQRGNMGIATRPGCLIVPSGERIAIGAWCLEIGDTDIFPQGVEIVKRKHITELNP